MRSLLKSNAMPCATARSPVLQAMYAVPYAMARSRVLPSVQMHRAAAAQLQYKVAASPKSYQLDLILTENETSIPHDTSNICKILQDIDFESNF